MPNPVMNITQIPAARVPFLDARTGLISREWYLFLFNLYNITGGGTNPVTINDLLQAPDFESLVSSQAESNKAISALQQLPNEFSSELLNIIKDINGLNQAQFDSQIANLEAKFQTEIQALSLAPVNTPQMADGRYGVFSDTTTQSAAVINTAYAISFDTTDISNGVYLGSPTSRVYVDRPGIYNFQFSLQLDQASASAHDAFIWADINGTTQANTGTKVTLVGNNAAVVAAWNFVFNMNAGDYFRLMWSVSNTAVQITAVAASAPVPAIPSAILTVTDNIGIKQ